MPPFILGQDRKIPPLKNQGWDTKLVFHGSTLVAYPRLSPAHATHWRCNGRIRQAISDPQLRSGIAPGRTSKVFSPADLSLRNFPGTRVFINAFLAMHFSTILRFCQGAGQNFFFRFTITHPPQRLTKWLHNPFFYVNEVTKITRCRIILESSTVLSQFLFT